MYTLLKNGFIPAGQTCPFTNACENVRDKSCHHMGVLSGDTTCVKATELDTEIFARPTGASAE
jgi:hypothetical protein